ncbi:heme/copper-type cytochrome/quinol oxidase subunit 2 [Bacillus thermophilus]|uniref:Heme/copper-type cytochrome/quinol oxidase subunit 2 n=1 Tax=Siminovitchia thermophila TaxID=1245522 RepID=A0ABS2RDA9_9BACI|nr:heme/copper-type cytochrome/quinol oxidase subunit 2 [Siminovitchia thermophila]
MNSFKWMIQANKQNKKIRIWLIVFIFIILIWRTYLFIQSYKQTGQISKVVYGKLIM